MKLARQIKSIGPVFSFALLAFCHPSAQAQGIPEPDVVYYGTIRNTGQYNARVTSGTLTWRFQHLTNGIPDGHMITMTLPLGNVFGQFSYALRVPCETSLGGSAVSTNPAVLQLLTTTNYYRSLVSVDGYPATFVNSALSNVLAAQTLRGKVQNVDLTINAPCDDNNPNGANRICDWWEFDHFGDWVDANADSDGDGLTNLQEFLAGTDPTDSSSVLIFTSYTPHADGKFEVTWQSVEGRSYTLQRFTSLLSTNYSIIRSNIPAIPPQNTFLDTNAVPPGPYFYQLKLEL